jgi:lipoprotein LprG
VVSVGGVVWAKLPLLPGYHKVDPATYGISDPGNLLNPDTGLTSLLVDPTDATYKGQVRVNGVVLDQVDATLSGEAVDKIFGSADPTKPVHAQFGIEPSNHEIRTAVITGPLFSTTQDSTFTIGLSNYGESITISAPS